MNMGTKKDLAALVGNKGFNIHYYYQMGLITPAKTSDGKWNYYDLDVEPHRIYLIWELQKMGNGIRKIRDILVTISSEKLVEYDVLKNFKEANKKIEEIQTYKMSLLKKLITK